MKLSTIKYLVGKIREESDWLRYEGVNTHIPRFTSRRKAVKWLRRNGSPRLPRLLFIVTTRTEDGLNTCLVTKSHKRAKQTLAEIVTGDSTGHYGKKLSAILSRDLSDYSRSELGAYI